MKCNYQEFKNHILLSYPSIKHQHVLNINQGGEKFYTLMGANGIHYFECEINSIDDGNDIVDYETYYFSNANKITEPYDKNLDAQKTRVVPLDGTIHWAPIFFQLGSETFEAGNTLGNIWEINYDDQENTTTIMFKPQWSYYIENGQITMLDNLPTNSDVLMYSFISPYTPYQWPFVDREKFTEDKQKMVIGSHPMYVGYYSDVPLLNQIQLIFVHHPNDNPKLKLVFKIHVKL